MPIVALVVSMLLSLCYDLFEIADGYHEVVVKSCLQAGHRENLEFSLNETIPYADCGVWILETHVEPSVIF